MVEETRVTPDRVDALAEKLAQFTQQLPEQERNILAWILVRASAATEQDVTGYLGLAPGTSDVETSLLPAGSLAAQLRLAAGLGTLRPGNAWITIKTPSSPR